MRSVPRTLAMTMALFVVVAVVFYLVILKPKYEDARQVELQVRSQKQAISGLNATLNSLPPIPDEERQLWTIIEQRLQATLLTEEGLMAGLARLADSVEGAGGTLATVTLEKAEQEEAQQPAANRRGRQTQPRSNEPRVRQPSTPSSETALRGRSANPSTPLLSAEAPLSSRRSVTTRSSSSVDTSSKAPVEVGMHFGRVRTVDYPATLEVKGDYASWATFLAATSSEFFPVLIEKIEGRPRLDGTQMVLSLTVPVVKGERGVSPSQAIEPAQIHVSEATANRYRLNELRENGELLVKRGPAASPAVLTPDPRIPFPDVVLSGVGTGLGVVRVSLIMERNGEYVAVVNEQVLAVGDKVKGLTVMRITPDTVVFAKNQ